MLIKTMRRNVLYRLHENHDRIMNQFYDSLYASILRKIQFKPKSNLKSGSVPKIEKILTHLHLSCFHLAAVLVKSSIEPRILGKKTQT